MRMSSRDPATPFLGLCDAIVSVVIAAVVPVVGCGGIATREVPNAQAQPGAPAQDAAPPGTIPVPLCPATASDVLAAVTPAKAVDYLAILASTKVLWSRGDSCAGASN